MCAASIHLGSMVALSIALVLLCNKLPAVQALGMYQSDIVLTHEQQATLEATSNPNNPLSPQRAVVRNMRSLWPNAVVPYIIDRSLESNARALNAIQAGIDEYKARSCVNFVPRTNERDYVRFFSGDGCFSYIGRVGGPQDISIGQGCEYRGIVMHEMFHALGRFHEQGRPDRDQFVSIQTANIQAGLESQFDKTSEAFVTTQGVAYDFGSVMHYGAYAFSRNRQPTIVPRDSNIALSDLGQRQGFSPSDITHVNVLYCGATAGTWSQWSPFSECSQTCNGGTRTRTRTCQGGSGCPGSNIDTQQCNTNPCPVGASWGAWTTWGECSATCGGGRQQRSRSCVGGNTCVGNNNEFRDCNTQSCPLPATWGSWGSWSSCSSTCQGGVRQRNRRCQNGINCPGAGIDMEHCNSNIPCTDQPNPNTGEWSQWSECTKLCGGGMRFRNRMCAGPPDSCQHQQEVCNTQPCAPEPQVRGLRDLGCYYYVPQFTRSIGSLEGLAPSILDDPWTRTNPILKCGMAAQNNVVDNFTIFAVTIGYCLSGSNRASDYQDFPANLCENGVGAYIGGYYLMNVYEIQDPQAFLDSSTQIISPSTVAPGGPTDSGSVVGGVTDSSAVDSRLNGAPVFNASLLALSLFAIFGIALQ